METLFGQFAALGASVAFSVTSTMFTLAGRRFGATLVMRMSVTIALACMFVLHWLLIGQPLPPDTDLRRWLVLGASGIIGFWLGSVAIINAFVLIGPRLSLLIAAAGPIISSILAWLFLGQVLQPQATIGIVLTVSGIAWVISDRRPTITTITPENFRLGVLFAIAGSFGQATTQILVAEGLSGDFDPISGSLMRLIAGTIALWLIAIPQRQINSSFQKLRAAPVAFRQLGVGALSGPVIGATLVVAALGIAPVGIVATLSNLMPIFLIPISYMVFKETITRRAIMGTVIAVTGTAILFLA